METLKNIPIDVLGTLLDLAYSYIQSDFSVLSKVPFSYRSSFSACIEYLRSKCGKHSSEYLKEVEEENWQADYKESVSKKLREFDSEYVRKKNKERINDINWRIDVALSTNSLSRVLKPEIQFKICNGLEESEFHMTVPQFQEFRRQTANIIKDIFTMEQFAFIRNLKQ